MGNSYETLMAREINEIPDVLNRQINDGLEQYLEAGRQAAAANPRGFITCARGTSDHAATFFNRHSPYTIQIRGNRTTFPPPRELYPLCSHPMA